MKTAFLSAYALTAIALFRRFPSDEALVRCLVIGIALAVIYGVGRLALRLLHIGR